MACENPVYKSLIPASDAEPFKTYSLVCNNKKGLPLNLIFQFFITRCIPFYAGLTLLFTDFQIAILTDVERIWTWQIKYQKNLHKIAYLKNVTRSWILLII